LPRAFSSISPLIATAAARQHSPIWHSDDPPHVALSVNLNSVAEDVRRAVTSRERLDAVRATGLLESPTEEEFDRLTRLAARLTGAPVTFISLVGEDRDVYKSCFGFPEPLASERQMTGTTFCHYALVSKGPLVIENTAAHPIYRTVPTVQSLGVAAYLGVPLVNSTGNAIGSFCAIDFKPRAWTPLDVEVMQELAASTLREIELRTTLASLDAEQRRLDVLLQHIPVGVVFAEAPSGRIVMRNRQAVELLGERELDSPDWTIARPDGTSMTRDEWPISRALRGEVVRNEELLRKGPDGYQVWLRVHAGPVLDVNGTIIGGVVAFHNIDKERLMAVQNERLYAEAQQANRAKDDFFAAVTHELRTPMTAIIGWARLLKSHSLDESELTEAVDAITDSARLQAQLVDDLLDISRISTGKLSLKREPLSIKPLLEQTIGSSQPVAESKGLRLRVKAEDDGVIEADPGRMRQIIGNLLSNAMKFTPRGGLIEVSSRTVESSVTITVRDTGRGIEPSLLPHIFERFRQATNAEAGGLGLGLTIVKHLVEIHGGEIHAESEGAGKGAVFIVRLPLMKGSPG
jgi:signal transduction histidine kinase